MQEIIHQTMEMGHIRVNKFDEDSAAKFHFKVTSLSAADPTHPIIVYIDSYGGNVDALASMVETIQSVPNRIVTVCIGKAMSAGAILLAAGDYRFCGKNSRIMIHELVGTTHGDPHDIKSSSNEIIRFNQYWVDFFAKKCGLKDYAAFKEILDKSVGREIHFNANGAKDFGIVDDIGIPVIKPLIMYHIDKLGEKPEGRVLNENDIDDALNSKPLKKTIKKKLKNDKQTKTKSNNRRLQSNKAV